jgi:hypothetical protein
MLPGQSTYLGITLTLADTNPHNLLSLLLGVDSTCPGAVSSLQIQSDDANGPNIVRIGDSRLGVARCGYRLASHEGEPYRNVQESIPLASIYVMAETAPCVINVELAAW